MNNKIPLRVLAQQMAQASGLSENECQEFVKALFQNVSDELYCGNEIVVDGVGTFSIDASKSEPVLFEVDAELAAELNAPFSFFQPIALSNSLEQDDLDRLHGIEEEEAAVSQNTDVTNPVEAVSVTTDSISIECSATEDVEKDCDDPTSDLASDVCDEVSTSHNKNMLGCEPTDDTDIVLPPEIPDLHSVPQIDETSDPGNVNAPSPSECDPNQISLQESIVNGSPESFDSNEEIGLERSDTEHIYIPEDEEEHVEYHHHRKSNRFWIGFIVGLLTGCVLTAVAYAIYVVQFS